MDFVKLITQLLPLVTPLVPNAGSATLLAQAAANILAYIQQQKGLTTEQILDRAGIQLDANEVELLADLARLQGTGGGGPSGPSGGGSASPPSGGSPSAPGGGQ
ncbi:MAG TPA: hypothetical protein VFZ44_02545 [Pyrinomonadaceae bacterium]